MNKTKYYGQDKETDRQVEGIIRHEILACQSSLVDALLGQQPQDYGDKTLISWDDTENTYYSDDDPECAGEAKEIYEWWLVTDTLARDLRELNEPLLDTDYGTWWGRTCTGQAIALDPTIYDVLALINKRIAERG